MAGSPARASREGESFVFQGTGRVQSAFVYRESSVQYMILYIWGKAVFYGKLGLVSQTSFVMRPHEASLMLANLDLHQAKACAGWPFALP